MLTPDKIKAKQFQTTGRGSYRAEDVDSFLQEVYASYEQAFRENGEIIKKMSILANKVEEYRKDEDSLRQALLSAQKLADKIVADAKQSVKEELQDAKDKSEKIVSEAKANAEKITSEAQEKAEKTVHDAKKEADEIIGGINRKVTQENLVFEMLQKEVSAFKKRMMDMYKEHLTLLDRLPSLAEEQTAQPSEEKQPEPEPEPQAETEPETEPVEEAKVREGESSETESGFSLDEIQTVEDTDTVLDGEDTYEREASEKSDDGFSLDLSGLDEEYGEGESDEAEKAEAEFTDISSSSDEKSDDGFSLDVSDMDYDVEQEEVNPEFDSVEPESVDDDDDDDDEGAISFRSFFKKK